MMKWLREPHTYLTRQGTLNIGLFMFFAGMAFERWAL